MDLPFIWAMLLAVAVLLYVLLDGFDLGVGILSTFADDDDERDVLTATIEPYWDGNETWLVLGGGGLFAAFPLAYSILMPAFYLPVLVMLAALIFRGVAFEFRHKAVRPPTKHFWNGAFGIGSLVAAFAQGVILGAFVQGVDVEGRAYSGGGFDWLTPFSILVGLSVVIGYVLLGSCWLILKTEGATQQGARKWARRALVGVALAMGAVSLATLSIDPRVTARWGVTMSAIDFGKFAVLAPIPLAAAGLLYLLWRDIALNPEKAPDWRPYLFSVAIFFTGYLGLGASIYPYAVPFAKTFAQAAARDNALSLLLVGAAVMLPLILVYTAYVYSLFWGKTRPGDGHGYHG